MPGDFGVLGGSVGNQDVASLQGEELDSVGVLSDDSALLKAQQRVARAESRVAEAEALADRLEKRANQARARAERQAALAAVAQETAARREETRRKILKGAYLEYCHRHGIAPPATAAQLLAALEAYLHRPGDRVLFGFSRVRCNDSIPDSV